MAAPVELTNPIIAIGNAVFLHEISSGDSIKRVRTDPRLTGLTDDQLRSVLEEADRYWHERLDATPHIGVVYAALVAECAEARLAAIGSLRRGLGEGSDSLDERMAAWIGVTVWAILRRGMALLVTGNAQAAWQLFAHAGVGARALPDFGALRLREALWAAVGQREAARLGTQPAAQAAADEDVARLLAVPGREQEAERYLEEVEADLRRVAAARELLQANLPGADEEQERESADEEQEREAADLGVEYNELVNRYGGRVEAGELDPRRAADALVADVDFSRLTPVNLYHLTLLHASLADADPARAAILARLNYAVAANLEGGQAPLTRAYAADSLGSALLRVARGQRAGPSAFAEAAAYLEEALPALDDGEAPEHAAKVVQKLGLAARGMGDFATARARAEEAIERWRLLEPSEARTIALAESYGNLADAHEQQGDVLSAFENHRRALELFLEGGSLDGARLALSYLSRLAEQTGRIDDVIAAAGRAAQLMAELADVSGAVEAYFTIARQAGRVGRLDEVLNALARAEDLLRPVLGRPEAERESLPLLYELLLWRGVVLSMLVRPGAVDAELVSDARTALEDARRAAVELDDADGIARAIVQLGKLSLRTGELEDAEAWAELVEHVPAGRPYQIEASELFAFAALTAGRHDEAVRLFAEVADAWGEEYRHRRMAALFRLGEARAAAGDANGAVSAYEASLEAFEEQRLDVYEETRLEMMGIVEEGFERLVSLLADTRSPVHDVGRAFHWVERSKSRTFLEMLGLSVVPPPGPLDGTDPDLIEERGLLDQVASLREQLFVAPDASADRFTLQRDLHVALERLTAVWDRLAPAHEEYVALRKGRVVAAHDLRTMLAE